MKKLASLLVFGVVLLLIPASVQTARAQACFVSATFGQLIYKTVGLAGSFWIVETILDSKGDVLYDLYDAATGNLVETKIIYAGCQSSAQTSPHVTPPSSASAPRTAGSTLPTGIAAGLAVTGDFNGDGIEDYALISGNSVIVHFGTGLPSTPFTTGGTYPVGQAPNAIAAADLNGDGVLDLVVVNQNDFTASVLLGNKGGTFQTQKIFTTGQYPITLAIGDLNGDGKPDIVVAAQAGIQLFRGNGDGTVGAPLTLSQGAAFAIAVADVTGDGKPDVFYTGGAGTDIYVLPGNGAGGFGTAIVSPGPPPGNAGGYFGLAYGDFNHDGVLDIVASRRGFVEMYLGQGGGKFKAPVSYVSGYTTDPAFAFDKTGNPYLITVDPTNQIATGVFGNPDGTLQAPRAYYTNSMGAVVAGDFNGDGKTDVVDVGYSFNPVSDYPLTVFTNAGNGTFTVSTPPAALAPGTPVFAVAGDFNGDGKLDIAAAPGNNNVVAVVLGNGNGTFQPAVGTVAGSGTIASIAAADFNGDGKTDLAVVTQANGASTVSVLLSTGGGNLSAGATVKPAGVADNVDAADLNGDGKPDFVVTTPSAGVPSAANVTVFLNQGNGTFLAGGPYAAGYGTVANSFLKDINGDGKPDLVVTTQNSSGGPALAVLLGNGDGTFQKATLVSTAFGPTTIVFGDFNGDGKMDMVVSHCCGNTTLSILFGNGDGTFQPEVLIPGGYSPSTVISADFNGDGKPDLLTSTQGGFDAVLLNTYPSFAAVVNAASIAGAGMVAPNSIASAFGSDLATQTAIEGSSLTDSLGGTSAWVIDSTGAATAAPLFYVSPAQVNLAIPGGVAAGAGQVQITSADGTVSAGAVTVAAVAPGVFSADGHLAAALALQANSQGQQSYSLTFQYNAASNSYSAVPINLGTPSDTTYLVLYGTGIRGAPLANVSVQVGNLTIAPAYAGATGTYFGEDQINVQLPYALKGAGDVTVTLTANGLRSNPVHVSIQ